MPIPDNTYPYPTSTLFLLLTASSDLSVALGFLDNATMTIYHPAIASVSATSDGNRIGL
jgi:hypothetical protein